MDETHLLLEDMATVMSPTKGGNSLDTPYSLELSRFLSFWTRIKNVEVSTAFVEDLMRRIADLEKLMAYCYDEKLMNKRRTSSECCFC